jgi:hypothetical protein
VWELRGNLHGGEHGKNSCIITPVKLMYPKLRANTGRVPGGPKMKRIPAQTIGAPKWIMPYGSHARTSSNGDVCLDRMVDRLAP